MKFITLKLFRVGAIALAFALSFSGAAPASAASNKYVAIAAGYEHTCALTSRGAVYCWGDNDEGQLGDGTIVDKDEPVRVVGSLKFKSITAGEEYTCALTSRGVAYCWGYNSTGQLGNGTEEWSDVPVRVVGNLKFKSIATGGYHTCALTTRGAAYCWGDNDDGRLGDGTTVDKDEPVPVVGSLKFASITAGEYHTCAATSRGVAYCWGDNGRGQLGDGNENTNSNVPSLVAGNLKFASLAGTQSATCALTSRGVAYCWGDNGEGTFGDGSYGGSATPTLAFGGMRAASLMMLGGGDPRGMCFITARGRAYCAGYNRGSFYSVLGAGSAATVNKYNTPQVVAGSQRWAAITMNDAHGCGITTRGVAYCWGDNGRGQLGTGDFEDTFGPVRVQ